MADPNNVPNDLQSQINNINAQLLQIQNNVQSAMQTQTQAPSQKFDKSYWIDKGIDIFKWVVMIGIVIIFDKWLPYGLLERQKSVDELTFYDRYTAKMFFETDNMKNRILIAEYFSKIIVNDNQRNRWKVYFDTLKVEYDALKKEKEFYSDSIKNTNDTAKIKELKNKIQAINLQLNLEKTNIIVPDLNNSNQPEKDKKAALEWEDKGFVYLINRDLNNAIKAFETAEQAYAGFHNVFEISVYLKKHQKELSNVMDDKNWRNLFNTLIKDYSYGMPVNYFNKFQELSN
jgi:hypothetical protein